MTDSLSGSGMTAALELANEHATDGIGVGDLADAAAYSPYHFSRVFSAVVGVSPGQYLTALRMDAAKRALLNGTDPVIDVATFVGFDSLSSFARRFRAAVGVPPAALRGLADDVGATTLTPFSLLGDAPRAVRIRLRFPAPAGPGVPRATWVGWFPRPVPIGLPSQGVLTWGDEASLPLSSGNPWLLAYSVPTTVDPIDLLTPLAPLVARSARPIIAAQRVDLNFSTADRFAVPLLPALPSLRRVALSRG